MDPTHHNPAEDGLALDIPQLSPGSGMGWDETAVYVGDVLFAIVPKGDPYQAKFVAAQLARLQIASAEAVARAFGFAATSLQSWVAQLQRTGTLYPGDFKPGPVGPRKVTPEIFRYIATHPARSEADMAQQIKARFDVELNSHTVRLDRLRLKATDPADPERLAQI